VLTLDRVVVEAMRTHALETYPDECVGVVFATPDGQVVRRLTNIQNRLHSEDPQTHSRDARTAYAPDPREFHDVYRASEQPGWKLLVLYHSHPEHGAYFSDTDRARALTEWEPREPQLPGTTFIVLSVYDRAVRDVRAYDWDEAASDFIEVAFTIA
jgi:proteasome lid subunit RPN8/RPN11